MPSVDTADLARELRERVPGLASAPGWSLLAGARSAASAAQALALVVQHARLDAHREAAR